MLRPILSAFAGEAVLLTLDTSMLWDQFCLIEVCLVWGERSFTLAQTVLEHGSATVGVEQYQPVLECAKRLLPQHSQVTLLADRGFEHSQLIHWLNQQGWSWAIRVKSNLQVQLTNGATQSVEQLIPPPTASLSVQECPGVEWHHWSPCDRTDAEQQRLLGGVVEPTPVYPNLCPLWQAIWWD